MRRLLFILIFLTEFIFGQQFTHSGYVYGAQGVGKQGVKVDLYTKETSQYTITYPTYSSPATYNSGTAIPSSDDVVSGALNIGFTFNFFGNNYTQFYVCSNGWVGFSAGQTNGYTAAFIPNASSPRNVIMADWEDLLPGTANIFYQTIGTAPNRRLVVSFFNCPHYSCRSNLHTFQFVLYETTNVIDINMTSKPLCAGNNSTQGLVNIDNTRVVPVDGRNASPWSVSTPQTIRITPQTPDVSFTYFNSYITDLTGKYTINSGLDINNYQFQIQIPIQPSPGQISLNDVIYPNDIVLGRITLNSKDYYRFDVNNDNKITISDVYSIFMKRAGVFSNWDYVPINRIFNVTEYNTINTSTSNLKSTIPGLQTVTLNSPVNGGTSNYYFFSSGYTN